MACRVCPLVEPVTPIATDMTCFASELRPVNQSFQSISNVSFTRFFNRCLIGAGALRKPFRAFRGESLLQCRC